MAEHEPVLRGDVLERVVQLGVDVEHLGAGVLDDVADLVGAEPEVHRHQHPAEAGDAEERREQPGAVLADHRHPVTEADAEAVEVRRLPAGQVADLGIGQVAERGGRLVGLVDHTGALAVHLHGTVDEVGDAERDEHGDLLMPSVHD